MDGEKKISMFTYPLYMVTLFTVSIHMLSNTMGVIQCERCSIHDINVKKTSIQKKLNQRTNTLLAKCKFMLGSIN